MACSYKIHRTPQTLWVQVRFQMSANIAGQPRFVRDQEVEAELIVGQPNGEEASVDHGYALEWHLRQPVWHVKIGQDAVDVAGFDQYEPAVIFGAVLGAIGDDGQEE